jgi:hypothetical protein
MGVEALVYYFWYPWAWVGVNSRVLPPLGVKGGYEVEWENRLNVAGTGRGLKAVLWSL